MELCGRLSSAFGFTVPPVTIFLCPSVKMLAAHILETFGTAAEKEASDQEDIDEAPSEAANSWFSSYVCKDVTPRYRIVQSCGYSSALLKLQLTHRYFPLP
jgi:hypothetical protein